MYYCDSSFPLPSLFVHLDLENKTAVFWNPAAITLFVTVSYIGSLWEPI